MLLQAALDLLSDDLQALPFVERFGGVTETVKFKNKRIPVSCSASEIDCTRDQFYQNLIPDGSKKGIMLWRPIDGFRDMGVASKNGKSSFRKYVGSATLIGWVNTLKLGVKDCYFASKLVRSILKILNKTFDSRDLVGTALEGGLLQFKLIKEHVKSPAIFDNYDFGDAARYTLFEFDYFAIDVEVVYLFDYNCEYNISLGNPIQCKNQSKL